VPRSRPLGALEVSARLVAVPFLMYLLQVALPAPWGLLGILPRTETGLVGVLFAPLLHANLAHLVSNATPLFVLLLLLFSDSRYRPEPTLAAIWLASGMGTWLIGRGDAVHIGASGIVFGLVSYLIVSGLMMRSWRAASVALVVLFLFGGVFLGALPQPGPISWEGHLCGAAAGVWSARYTHGRSRGWSRRREPLSWSR
jgi:membrane associated rhomboid family serine protease